MRSCFVKNNPFENESSDSSEESNSDSDYADDGMVPWRNILALIRIGFTLENIRYMSMSDAIYYLNLYASDMNEAHSENYVQPATQEAIDMLLA